MQPEDSAANEPEPRTVVSSVVVVTREFPARPGSLPEAEEFVHKSLIPSVLDADERRSLFKAITDAILLAAGPDEATFEVVVRLFPDQVEVEVLYDADHADAVLSRSAALSGTGDSDESFAAWLKATLSRQGLSQEAAARQIGVSVRTVNRWVRGQAEPRMSALRRVRDVLNR